MGMHIIAIHAGQGPISAATELNGKIDVFNTSLTGCFTAFSFSFWPYRLAHIRSHGCNLENSSIDLVLE